MLFGLSGSTTAVYNDVDKALLGHFGMDRANGIYTIAYRIVDICTIPIISVQSVALPRLFRDGLNGAVGSAKLSGRILRRSAPVALVCGIGIFLLAPVVPRVAGIGFDESVSALRWLCLLPLFRSFQLTAGDAITACGRQDARFLAQAAAAVFNFGANLYLIPHFSWRGAAWSSIATDAMLAALNWAVLIWLLSSDPRKRDQLVETRNWNDNACLPSTADVK
jgi:O-antigen/teichoic acid export membrane protein